MLELQLSRRLHGPPTLCSHLTLRALEVADSSPSCGFVHTVHTLTVGISSVKDFSLCVCLGYFFDSFLVTPVLTHS